jgi:hypothetical protein
VWYEAGMFALVAAVIAFAFLIFDFSAETALWLWLGFIALHFAVDWWPFAWSAPNRRR